MALRLKRKRSGYRAIPLGAGASIMLRAATYAEVQEAAADVAGQLAGIVVGSAAAAVLAPLLGEEFDLAEMSEGKLAAASDKLVTINLIMACQAGWSGVIAEGEDGEDVPIVEPTAGYVALLVRDVAIARRLRAVVEAAYHEETAEGNGLPGSPRGGSGSPDTAPDARPPARPALPDGQA